MGTLAAFADALDGTVDKANADKAEIIGFDSRCKARDAALVKAVTHKSIFARVFG